MRLGEFKKNLEKVLNENLSIDIKSEPLFNNQAYVILNWADIVEVIRNLEILGWGKTDTRVIDSLLSKSSDNSLQVNAEEFNSLNDFINQLNPKLPLYIDILNSLVRKQDEQVVNIKLPSNIETFDDLDVINKRLKKLLKQFTNDGSVSFVGFDKGTDWYVICLSGYLTYHFFVGAMSIAKAYLDLKESYWKSEKARLDYMASLDSSEDVTEAKLDAYTEKRLNLEIEMKVKELLKNIEDMNGKTRIEQETNLIMATKSLIKELGEGTEFHLSLNPPAYVAEKQGEIIIDYKKLAEVRKDDEIANGKTKVALLGEK